jgi:uncharacterized membrane protein YphA (DoxX/SURF4 family)
MTIVDWIFRVLVGVVFAGHGAAFIAQPPAAKAQLQNGPLSLGQFRLLGIAEVAGGIAIVVLQAADTLRPIRIAALAGIAIVLLGAVGIHAKRKEPPGVVFTGVLLVLTVFLLVRDLG